MVRTVTVNLNVTDLYKILAENPDEASNVLRNIYGFEILKLKREVQETVKFIQDEDGLDGSRDKYIEDELGDLAEKFDEATLLMQFFRFVDLTNGRDGSEYTSDKFMSDLGEAKMLIDIEAKFFVQNIRLVRIELSKAGVADYDKFEEGSHGEKIFRDWKETSLRRLEETIELIDTIDSKIGSK